MTKHDIFGIDRPG